jgi:hypothetical protein
MLLFSHWWCYFFHVDVVVFLHGVVIFIALMLVQPFLVIVLALVLFFFNLC